VRRGHPWRGRGVQFAAAHERSVPREAATMGAAAAKMGQGRVGDAGWAPARWDGPRRSGRLLPWGRSLSPVGDAWGPCTPAVANWQARMWPEPRRGWSQGFWEIVVRAHRNVCPTNLTATPALRAK